MSLRLERFVIFKSLFSKKKNITNQPPLPKPKAPHSTPEEISQLFTSTLLTDNYQGISELSNDIDQKLLQVVMSELRDFDTSTIPKIAEASIKLMDKLLDPEICSSEVVAVIKEDPALLGKLMQTANSAFHRKSPTEIKTLDDAVVLIGNDEIRKLVIGALVSGQLKISSVYFKFFGANIWTHSYEVATMASHYAKNSGINEFRAYLNGLIHDVGKLIIFRLLVKVLEQSPPGAYPSQACFSFIIDRYGHQLTLTALKEWSLDPEWIKPILTYRSNIPSDKMDIDSRALFISNHCSELRRLHQLKLIDDEELSRLLFSKGIEQATYAGLIKSLKI